MNRENKCEKQYPKCHQEFTTCSEEGHTTYRRRSPEQGGNTIEKTVQKKQTILDNKWVVPYNPYLLLKYEGHCNVEYVNTVQSVKYLYKYVLKGPDKVHVEIFEVNDTDGTKKKIHDEIKQFAQGRYYDSSQSIPYSC